MSLFLYLKFSIFQSKKIFAAKNAHRSADVLSTHELKEGQ